MAQVSSQHVPQLTYGFVGLLLFSLFGIGVLNHLADK